MAKVWTREELTKLTQEEYNALSKDEKAEVVKQGTAFKTKA